VFRSARYWLVRNVGRLLISGTHQVEFTDFWLGDQVTSLAFPLGNMYLLVCSYTIGLEQWRQCGSQSKTGWPVAFALASLPSFLRMVQSVRRYADSRLYTHLINGGKYGMGIVYYFCYYLWRHQGRSRTKPSFVAFCVFATVNALYTSTWDLLMDWSLLNPHGRYPFLRSEILYTSHVPLYYVAMIINVLIRFVWVIYIPLAGPSSIYLSQFIAALLEALRRWQWNFYRLENEHVGNMDQYRVTREVPLPYSLEEDTADDDKD
ncbi:EXS-domain-containing protein, partial [Marasmius fiardii PR-910]